MTAAGLRRGVRKLASGEAAAEIGIIGGQRALFHGGG